MSLVGALAPWFVLLILVTVVVRVMRERSYDRMHHARWEPQEPGPGHAPLERIVSDLVEVGYAVDSYSVVPGAPRPISAVALVHPDGTLAMALNIRSLGGLSRPHLTIQSIVLPGERSMTTVNGGAIAALPADLIEVAARRVDVARMRRVHERNRAWLQVYDVRTVPVALGQAGPVIEAGMSASAERRTAVGGPKLLWRQMTGGGPLRRPLPERAAARPTIVAVRARQREQGFG